MVAAILSCSFSACGSAGAAAAAEEPSLPATSACWEHSLAGPPGLSSAEVHMLLMLQLVMLVAARSVPVAAAEEGSGCSGSCWPPMLAGRTALMRSAESRPRGPSAPARSSGDARVMGAAAVLAR